MLLYLLIFQGRGFHVQIHYVEEPVSDYVQAAVSTVVLINDQVPWRLLYDISSFIFVLYRVITFGQSLFQEMKTSIASFFIFFSGKQGYLL